MHCYKNSEGSKGIHGVGKRILIPMSMEIQIFTTSVLLEEHMHHVPMGCATGYYRYKYSCVVMRTMEWTTAGQVILLSITIEIQIFTTSQFVHVVRFMVFAENIFSPVTHTRFSLVTKCSKQHDGNPPSLSRMWIPVQLWGAFLAGNNLIDVHVCTCVQQQVHCWST